MNTSSNISSMDYPEPDDIVKVFSKIQKYSNPVFCFVGLIGGILALTVFLNKSQRSTSCCQYLAVRSVSDIGFLISLIIVWITDVFDATIFNSPGVCQMTIFLSYICGFLSVWFVVIVTAENYIRICHPFSVSKYCTTKISKIIISIFLLLALALYNFPLWTLDVSEGHCKGIARYDELFQMFIHMDTVLTLILPALLITFLMVAITFSLARSYHRLGRLKGKRTQKKKSRKSNHSKVTKLLFTVSLVFLALNLPSHVIRTMMTLSRYIMNRSHFTTTELVLQKLFYTLYYLSYAINLFIYLFCGTKFRKNFHEMYIECFAKSCKRAKEKKTNFHCTRQVNRTHAKEEGGDIVDL
ncbi:G-protein coupled receptor 183-A-like [Ostrea edulis]|uniref:G-protein coupled receptor 183-A-like n=1 Tax=Ostrea edulis TaxID=37623 RepID=UPI0024AFA399|nr:G-protein coupled receptor 183-A-like [Ostrea edulis]